MELLVTFPDTHNAIRGEQVLLAAGVPVRVMSLPGGLGSACGICLRIDAGDLPRAEELFLTDRIARAGVYRKTAGAGIITYETVK